MKNKPEFTLPAYQWWIIIALVAGFYLLLLSGCQVCADCQCRTYSTQPGADPVTSEFEVCGRDDIRDTRGVSKQTVTVGGKTYTSTTDCDCRYK